MPSDQTILLPLSCALVRRLAAVVVIGVPASVAAAGAPAGARFALPDHLRSGPPCEQAVLLPVHEVLPVAIDGDVGVLGGHDAEVVSVYRFDGEAWSHEQTLAASDGERGDGFGESVTVRGSIILVGARGDDDGGRQAGAVYAFGRDAVSGRWEEQQKLVADDAVEGDEFGTFVSTCDGTLVVGAPGVAPDGAAYVFRRDGAGRWSLRQRLLSTQGDPLTAFGRAGAVANDVLVVGQYGNGPGNAIVFRLDEARETWSLEQELPAPDDDVVNFGRSVATRDDAIVIGAVWGVEQSTLGRAWVYEHDGDDGWSGRELVNDDGDPPYASGFGRATVVGDGLAIVGASRAGIAYVFEADGAAWRQTHAISPTNGGDGFGLALGFDGDRTIVGAERAGFVFDATPRVADLDCNDAVDVGDLLILLHGWGLCPDCDDCSGDVTDDCRIDDADILVLLGDWG